MKDDTFELLTRMYADFTLQFKEVKSDISTLKGSVARIELKLENETDKKIDILLETRGEVNNHLEILENKIDIISSKVDKHDIEIKVIRAAK